MATLKKTEIGLQDQLLLNAGQRYCRMLQESILQYSRPSLSYHFSLRFFICLFLSGRFTQVLLYFSHFLLEIFAVGTLWKHLNEMLPMSTHNICFQIYNIRKLVSWIITLLSYGPQARFFLLVDLQTLLLSISGK